jgi:hypothetical protein
MVTTKSNLSPSLHDLKLELQAQTLITRSKAFNLQMLLCTLPAWVYFWWTAEHYVFNSPLSNNTLFWLSVFGVVPCMYGASLFFDQPHGNKLFRVGCRILPVGGVGLWKLVASALLWTDSLAQTPLLTIRKVWTVSQKQTYITLWLQNHDGRLPLDVRKNIAQTCETLNEIDVRLAEVLNRMLNPSVADKLVEYTSQNWLGICGFVCSLVIGAYFLSSVTSTFNTGRTQDLQRLQALENQLDALTQRTQALSLKLSTAEQAVNHNQYVSFMRFASLARNAQTVSQDVANLGATMLP